jgi:DNA-binding GntR family transcriptional regulator
MGQKVFEQIVRSDTLVEVVIQQITDAIVTGRLQPGDKLVEAQMGQQLGVSRAPLREAFQRLEQIGLVEKIPNRGTFVSTLTERDVKELHNVRELLEGLAARMLAERRDPQAIDRLNAILDAMRQAADDGEPSRMITLDADFHDALIELSEHKLLRELWVVMGVRLRRFLLLKRQRLYPSLADAAPLHEPIVQAIAAGDPVRAEAQARKHVLDAAQNLGYFTDQPPQAQS